MPLPVSLDAVVQELECLMDEMTAYINRKTGELASISHEEAALAEDEEEPDDDLPAWQVEMLPKIREILFSGDWVRLPNKFDIHEWEIMRKFADDVESDALSNELQRAIHGKGAFRMFRATLERTGKFDDWHAFKHQALRKIAREALDRLEIPHD
jgi:hypothetical protein